MLCCCCCCLFSFFVLFVLCFLGRGGCVRAWVRECVRACVRACVRVCVCVVLFCLFRLLRILVSINHVFKSLLDGRFIH